MDTTITLPELEHDTDGTFPLTLPIHVSVQDVKDLCCTAMEGGVNYWVQLALFPNLIWAQMAPRTPVCDIAAFTLLSGESVALHHGDDEEAYEVAVLSLPGLMRGLARYAALNGARGTLALETDHQGVRLDLGQIDACDADNIFQLAVFGEVRFA